MKKLFSIYVICRVLFRQYLNDCKGKKRTSTFQLNLSRFLHRSPDVFWPANCQIGAHREVFEVRDFPRPDISWMKLQYTSWNLAVYHFQCVFPIPTSSGCWILASCLLWFLKIQGEESEVAAMTVLFLLQDVWRGEGGGESDVAVGE